jgi:hypothetical protein
MGPTLSCISPSTGPKTPTTDNPYAAHRQQAYEPVGGRPLVRLQQIAQRSGPQQVVNEAVVSCMVKMITAVPGLRCRICRVTCTPLRTGSE